MVEEEDYIKENHIPNQPKPMSLKELEILTSLSKTHICKITCNDGRNGAGFFCNIPFGWGNFLSVLMTNNHVLDLDSIQPGQTINFSLANDNKRYKILIDESR